MRFLRAARAWSTARSVCPSLRDKRERTEGGCAGRWTYPCSSSRSASAACCSITSIFSSSCCTDTANYKSTRHKTKRQWSWQHHQNGKRKRKRNTTYIAEELCQFREGIFDPFQILVAVLDFTICCAGFAITV